MTMSMESEFKKNEKASNQRHKSDTELNTYFPIIVLLCLFICLLC